MTNPWADTIANSVAAWIMHEYKTGIGWLQRDDNTVTVDWVDGSSDKITITVERVLEPPA